MKLRLHLQWREGGKEGRKLALFVTTFPADESHNFVLVPVFRVVKPAPGVGSGGFFRGNLLF